MDFPNKTSIYNGSSIAMLNYQRVSLVASAVSWVFGGYLDVHHIDRQREKASHCSIVNPVFGNTPSESPRTYFCYPGIHIEKDVEHPWFPIWTMIYISGGVSHLYMFYIGGVSHLYIYILYVRLQVSCRLAPGAVSFRFCGPRKTA